MPFSKRIHVILLIWLLPILLASQVFAASSQKPLETDQAFVLSTEFKNDVLSVHWQIAPGYYLYRDRIAFSFEPSTPANTEIPKGVMKSMPDGERLEVFENKVTVPVRLQSQANSVQMNVHYQGCSKSGFCYPPVKKSFALNLQDKTSTPLKSLVKPNNFMVENSLPDLLTNQQGIQHFLSTHNIVFSLLVFLGLGLLLAFTPCVLPMVPILTSIIVGQQHAINTRKAFWLSFAYVLGTAVTYAIAGILAAAMGSLLQVALQKPIVIASASVFFVLLSLSLFGVYDLSMPSRFQNHIVFLSNRQKSGKYVGVFVMGVLSTLIISPCVTAPLIGVLLFISESKDMLYGASALFALGIGMGIPLLLIGTSAGKWLPRTGSWMEAIKKICGFALIAMAIWLASRIISQEFTYALWALLLFALALFLVFYLPQLIGKHLLNKSLGFLAALSGVVLLLASLGITHPWSPKDDNHSFVIVRDIKDVDTQLAIAKNASQPVLIDFYADWCEACIVMDKKVFKAPDMQPVLSEYKLLRVDLTNNTSADEKLMQKFAVLAPPTVLYFDAKGREINSKRIVGEVDAKEFLARINAENAE